MLTLSGKELAKQIREDISNKIKTYVEKGNRPPCLTTILVGDDPASQVYVLNKTRACNEVGIKNITTVCNASITEDKLIELVEEYSADPRVDGILVQLPLPKHINQDRVLNAIHPNKDVDGFKSSNVAKLWLGHKCIKPCTPQGIIDLLDYGNIDLRGKHVVVIGRSNIVGLPVSKMCLDRNATVTICHSKTKNLKEITQTADVLIVAIGKPKFINNNHLKPGAVVIDVGINRVDGKLFGDVDHDSITLKASYSTPVPGGVGPMTIACLLKNTLECYEYGYSGKKDY